MKRLHLLLSLMLLTALLAFPHSVAAAVSVRGSCGDGLTWSFDDSSGLLTISKTGEGTGIMAYDTTADSPTPWFAYRKQITSIEISSDVTSICEGAFYGCEKLESITIPFVGGQIKTATDTYQYPFGYIFGSSYYSNSTEITQLYYDGTNPSDPYACPTYYLPLSLRSVTILGGNILYGAFYGCSNLTSISLPASAASIGTNAFSGCSSLTSFSVPESSEALATDASGVLYSKDFTTLYCYPAARTREYYSVSSKTASITAGAFKEPLNLKTLYIPSSVTQCEDDCIFISDSHPLTVCLFENSAADAYCKNYFIKSCYMDGYTVQDIAVVSPPSHGFFAKGKADFSGLVMTMTMTDEEEAQTPVILHLNERDCEFIYDKDQLGLQDVTVQYNGKECSFRIFIYETGYIPIVFNDIEKADLYYVAICSKDHQLVALITPTIINGDKAIVFISPESYESIASVKLFSLSSSFVPEAAMLSVSKEEASSGTGDDLPFVPS